MSTLQHNQVNYSTGFVTLPVETGKEKEVLDIVKKWGADALRNSDGTTLSQELVEMDCSIYSTLCLVRHDQKWADRHPEQLVQKFLMSMPKIAISASLEIDLLEGYFIKKYQIDNSHNWHKWWQVIDRTSGELVPVADWDYAPAGKKVIINNCNKFHKYTVNFLVYQVWDSTSMYNHLTNGWTCDPIKSVDPYHAATQKHLLLLLDEWLATHPKTDVVRLTSLFYHFTLDSNEKGKEQYVDSYGYTDCISPQAIDDFEKITGLKLSSEDIVDQGYYNALYRCPSEKYLTWMKFIHKFVINYGTEIVEHIHRAGKKAAIFLGDHHIGVEPYSKEYQKMQIDIDIGAPGNALSLRRLAEIPGSQIKEARFYPYLFPDIFKVGSNPVEISFNNWAKIRRGLLRKCIDRIGYGGYLSLALKFPKFVDHIADICNEFRELLEKTQKTPAYTANIKVAVLNAWGNLRSWEHYSSITEKFLSDEYLVLKDSFLESLAGLPVDVSFISFDDIRKNAIPDDINVIINAGEAGTAWSGDEHWREPQLVSAIRSWVYKGGGFIGIKDPTAVEYQGSFFQLSDVLGVQKETGKSIYAHPPLITTENAHFIIDDQINLIQSESAVNMVYPVNHELKILARDKQNSILLSTNTFGAGRAVYISDLPHSSDNARILLRSLFWADNSEDKLGQWFSSNPEIDCAAYPETGNFVVVNSSKQTQKTVIYKKNNEQINIQLDGYERRWFRI